MDLIPQTKHYKRHAHPTRTVVIGKIPPGGTRIYITPKEDMGRFFRLVGVSITIETAVPLKYGFGIDFNH